MSFITGKNTPSFAKDSVYWFMKMPQINQIRFTKILKTKKHDKIRIAVIVVMWLFKCGNLTIQHKNKNCYFNLKKQWYHVLRASGFASDVV